MTRHLHNIGFYTINERKCLFELILDTAVIANYVHVLLGLGLIKCGIKEEWVSVSEETRITSGLGELFKSNKD